MLSRGPGGQAESAERVYVVSHPLRRAARVRCEREDGTVLDVVVERRHGRLDWMPLARAVLEDALPEPPPGRMARDYAYFLPVGRGKERRMTATEVRTWASTWRPPLSTLFPRRSRRG